jgi:hypothetical protein
MLQAISKFNRLLLAASISLSGLTFNSPKVDAIISQNINQQSLSNILSTASEWKRFSPDDGRFSILMPSQSVNNITPDKSQIHEGIKSIKMYLSNDETNSFMVGYADFKTDITQFSPSEILDSFLEGMLEGEKKLISQQDINLGKYPGREVQLLDEKSGITMTARIFVVNNRMYTLFVGSSQMPEVSDVRKFFDSFELIQ